ncbi:hypothetical protein FISHEDRAFT_73085 [Fistulina hepatica ATCC 64428]|uniref:Tyr recombinase domain-containing protein n=1 Tax=Fistulina hepatica ATCC 64428 TaxID=1128425 RepID=A0A0D7ADN3_9AGAR|nr:hypothetical protein FISHEDRAFT_73085 [Fistulina hepatica ATCC 64428]
MYNIYPQQDIPALDAYGHLNIWQSVLSARTGSPMSGADCVFPFFQNSAPHCQRPMTHEVAQSLINRFATGAGLNKEFTTHSLRRGGAQYRFIHAPLGQRWSLTMIQWWGGWAAGEQIDTLIHYLLNSLQNMESSYSDALNPLWLDASKSLAVAL